jgi:hypothetical protein
VIEIGNYAVVIQTDQNTKIVCWKAKVKGKDEFTGSFIGIAVTRLSCLLEEFTSLYINFSFNFSYVPEARTEVLTGVLS